jgi:hypothetical protein
MMANYELICFVHRVCIWHVIMIFISSLLPVFFNLLPVFFSIVAMQYTI